MKKEYIIKIEFSQEAFELLKTIEKTGGAEYRDTEFHTKEDFLKSDTHLVNNRSLEWFLDRNENGTYHLIDELLEYDLVDNGDCSDWHITFYITELGLKLINNNLG